MFHRRLGLIAVLAVVTPLGLWTKAYGGPGHVWFDHYGGGVLYVVFWSLAGALVLPTRRAAAWIAGGVLLVTCGLEVLQLWHPVWLQAIRGTFLGGTLLGTTFVWWDFPHYLLGCLLGYGIVRLLHARVPRAGGVDRRRS